MQDLWIQNGDVRDLRIFVERIQDAGSMNLLGKRKKQTIFCRNGLLVKTSECRLHLEPNTGMGGLFHHMNIVPD